MQNQAKKYKREIQKDQVSKINVNLSFTIQNKNPWIVPLNFENFDYFRIRP